MQSYCEIITGVCNTVKDVEHDLTEKVQWVQDTAEDLGVELVWAGTHPFSRWEHQKITPGDRYQWLLDAMQDALAKGDHVKLVGFGTFDVRQRAARAGVNPQTKKKMKIRASKAVHFRAGRPLKDAVRGD